MLFHHLSPPFPLKRHRWLYIHPFQNASLTALAPPVPRSVRVPRLDPLEVDGRGTDRLAHLDGVAGAVLAVGGGQVQEVRALAQVRAFVDFQYHQERRKQ